MSRRGPGLSEWLAERQQSLEEGNFQFSRELLSSSLEFVRAHSLPTRKDEEWRYTPLQRVQAASSEEIGQKQISQAFIDPLKQASPEAQLIVLVDGRLNTDFSDSLQDQSSEGLSITPLSDISREERTLAEGIISNSMLSDDNIFQHLSLLLTGSGLFIQVSTNAEVPRPLHIVHISGASEGKGDSQPVMVLNSAENSRLTLIQQFVSLGESPVLTIPAEYIHLNKHAALSTFKIGLEADHADHISNSAVRLEESAQFENGQYLLGSSLSRWNTEISMNGSHCETRLRGVYKASGDKHLEVRTFVDHAQPECRSDQQFRGVMENKGHGVFNGLVLVRKDAQKTDAKQSNKNLLLSRDARVDTKPQLEILADDVKCSHGATVGELDKDALFYLQTRGIGQEEAALMLTRAFVTEILDEIPIQTLSDYVRNEFEKTLEGQ